MNKLEQLRKMTTIVVDTGDIDAIKKFTPIDATTNPSLILKAIEKPQYRHLIEEAIKYSEQNKQSNDHQMALLMDKLFVNFGAEILKIIPGRVSTEVDARLSYDVEGSIRKAQALIELYKQVGIDKERVLIKLASTWEGGLAATQLEKMGIHCNMTLLFSLVQGIHCAKANATLVSPFVGRILDWYKEKEGVKGYAPAEDPGVRSVTQIYHYFKKYQYKTLVMGASFRNTDEILELAGCDLLTISPQLLGELSEAQGDMPRKLEPAQSNEMNIPEIKLDEKTFKFLLNDNAMAYEKLGEGIRLFARDAIKLEDTIRTNFKIC